MATIRSSTALSSSRALPPEPICGNSGASPLSALMVIVFPLSIHPLNRSVSSVDYIPFHRRNQIRRYGVEMVGVVVVAFQDQVGNTSYVAHLPYCVPAVVGGPDHEF